MEITLYIFVYVDIYFITLYKSITIYCQFATNSAAAEIIMIYCPFVTLSRNRVRLFVPNRLKTAVVFDMINTVKSNKKR